MNELFLSMLLTGVQIVIVILAVDFASGVLHWLEDSYGKPSWPFLGKHVIEPNILHHFRPRAFTKTSVWRRNSGTMVICGSLMVMVVLLGGFHWMWLLACVLGAISNEIHCWAHRSPRENGKFITCLQRMGLIQSRKAHARHHTDPKNQSYCTVTNFLNPMLDAVQFFGRMEGGIFLVTGKGRRKDESVRIKRKRNPVCRSKVGEECVSCPRGAEKVRVPDLR
jgi:ubiquitin-conjugating enzyme E2 variant